MQIVTRACASAASSPASLGLLSLSLACVSRPRSCRSNLRTVSACAAPHTALAEERCSPEPPSLRAIRLETEELMPSGAHMMSGAQQGRLLQMLVRVSGARRILELGCFTGYATTWMALGLPRGGTIVTCERDERAAEVARRHFAMNAVESVDVVMGDALDAVLGMVAEGEPGFEGPFDLVFLDADKKRYGTYCRELLDKGLLAPDGLLLADNVLWKNKVLELLPPAPPAAAAVANAAANAAAASASSTVAVPAPPRSPSAPPSPRTSNPWTDAPRAGESAAKAAGRERRSDAIRDALHLFSLELKADARLDQLLLPLRDGLTWAQLRSEGGDEEASSTALPHEGTGTPQDAGDAEAPQPLMARYLATVGSAEPPAHAELRAVAAHEASDAAADGIGAGAGAWPLRGRLLHMLVRLCGASSSEQSSKQPADADAPSGDGGNAQRVLELRRRVGGYETLWLASALRPGGTLLSFAGADADGGGPSGPSDGTAAAGEPRIPAALRTALRAAGVEEGQVRVAARPAGPFTSETVVAAAGAGEGLGHSYDVVVCGEVSDDLPATPRELTAALESLAALLAPNGLLVLAQSAASVPSSELHEALQAARVQPRPTPGGGAGSSLMSRRLQSVALPAPDGDGGLITLAMLAEDAADGDSRNAN